MSDTDPRREAAVRRLKAKRDLRTNLVGYVVVNAFLVVIWAVTGANFFWPIFIIGGWGFGLAMHAWTVYGQKSITEEDLTREMERGGGDVVE